MLGGTYTVRTRKAHLGVIATRDHPHPFVVTAEGSNLKFHRKYAKSSTLVPLADVLDRVRGHAFTVGTVQFEAKSTATGVVLKSPLNEYMICWSDLAELASGQRIIL